MYFSKTSIYDVSVLKNHLCLDLKIKKTRYKTPEADGENEYDLRGIAELLLS